MPPLISLLRPHQWVKNAFVGVGLIFGHAWGDTATVHGAVAAFVAFCLLSSSVYVMNDFIDREQDRQHPDKCRRPLACGTVTVPQALMLALACLGTSLGMVFGVFASLGLPASQAPWIFVTYLVINVGYSLGLKHTAILDVFLIAAGFMLRILAGTLGIGIAPSEWLLLCGLMLTLFLGFAKRRAELNALAVESASHRPVLDEYTQQMLDQFITIAAAATVITYSLYTLDAETVERHGTHWLIVTVPCVIYGLLRYLYRLHRAGGGGDPARELLSDPHLLTTAGVWLGLVLCLLA